MIGWLDGGINIAGAGAGAGARQQYIRNPAGRKSPLSNQESARGH